MKIHRDVWRTSYRQAMAQARQQADVDLSVARRQLDVDLANPKAQMGSLLASWFRWRTHAAMHKCVTDMQASSADFFDAVEHSAAGTKGGPN